MELLEGGAVEQSQKQVVESVSFFPWGINLRSSAHVKMSSFCCIKLYVKGRMEIVLTFPAAPLSNIQSEKYIS